MSGRIPKTANDSRSSACAGLRPLTDFDLATTQLGVLRMLYPLASSWVLTPMIASTPVWIVHCRRQALLVDPFPAYLRLKWPHVSRMGVSLS